MQQACAVGLIEHVVEAVNLGFVGADRLNTLRERTDACHFATLAPALF